MTGDLVVTIAELGHLPMTTSIACDECPETFTGAGMWNAYARHLRTEHPQTEPTPPQREPEPPAQKEDTVPPNILTCEKCGREFDRPQAIGNHRRHCKGDLKFEPGPDMDIPVTRREKAVSDSTVTTIPGGTRIDVRIPVGPPPEPERLSPRGRPGGLGHRRRARVRGRAELAPRRREEAGHRRGRHRAQRPGVVSGPPGHAARDRDQRRPRRGALTR